MVDPSSSDDFVAKIKVLDRLTYFKRRCTLWHKNKPRLPRYLYKFRVINPDDPTTMKRLSDIIVGCRLRLSSPSEFNDPFDMQIRIVVEGRPAEIREQLDALYKRQGLKWAQRRKNIERDMRNLDRKLVSRFEKSFREAINAAGVCSFGGNPRDILMWSHYADITIVVFVSGLRLPET